MRTTFALILLAGVSALPLSAKADHPTVGFGAGVAGPITTIGADVLPRGRGAAALRLELSIFDAFTDTELLDFDAVGEHVHSVDRLYSPSLGLAYGISARLTLTARLPYVARTSIRAVEDEGSGPEVHDHGDARGIGDLFVLGIGALAQPKPGRPGVALLGGVKLPVGQKHVQSGGEFFEVEHQPGSGAYDLLLGLAASLPRVPVALSANVLYTVAFKGAYRTDLGDVFSYNLAGGVRLVGGHEEIHIHPDGTEHVHTPQGTALDATLEFNGEWHGHQTTSPSPSLGIVASQEENSGGNVILCSPGLRLSLHSRWSIFATAGFPVVDNSNGIQHETRVRSVMGIGVAF